MTAAPDDTVDRAAGGDRRALSELLERHGPAAREAIRGGVPERWRALVTDEDVMQEAYLRAFLHVAELQQRSEGGFRRWLAALARSALLDVLKTLRTEKRGGRRLKLEAAAGDTSIAALWEVVSSGVTSPSLRASRNEQKDWLLRVLQELPEPYRAVVQGYDLEGLPIEDVARRLGRSPGAAFMLRARALDRLRQVLAGASSIAGGP